MGDIVEWSRNNDIAYLNVDALKDGYAYQICGRRANVGIWVKSKGTFVIPRSKFGTTYLFEEGHWDLDESFGTAKPLKEIDTQNKKIYSSDPLRTNDTCAATLSPELKLHIPFLILSGSFYWADLENVPATVNFVVTNYGAADPNLFANCSPTVLSSTLSLHVPEVK